MSAHELELLARLVQQFPGSGVSAVLMFSDETSSVDVITRQNKQFVSWALEMPTAEQKLSTIQQARKSGHEEAAVQFFNRMTKRAVKTETPSVRATETAAAAAARGRMKVSSLATLSPWIKRSRDTGERQLGHCGPGRRMKVSMHFLHNRECPHSPNLKYLGSDMQIKHTISVSSRTGAGAG
jgi:hypothetical protein